VQLEPLGDYIICEREPEADVTEGGIIIPDCAKAKSIIVTILGVGTGRLLQNGKRLPPAVKPKDKVIIGKYTGSEFQHNLQTYLVIKEQDIQARLVPEKKRRK